MHLTTLACWQSRYTLICRQAAARVRKTGLCTQWGRCPVAPQGSCLPEQRPCVWQQPALTCMESSYAPEPAARDGKMGLHVTTCNLVHTGQGYVADLTATVESARSFNKLPTVQEFPSLGIALHVYSQRLSHGSSHCVATRCYPQWCNAFWLHEQGKAVDHHCMCICAIQEITAGVCSDLQQQGRHAHVVTRKTLSCA